MLRFDNAFVRELPGDPDPSPRSRQVAGAAWSPVAATPVAQPRLLGWSDALAEEMGLAGSGVSADAWAQVLGGNQLLPGMQAWASGYGGHQFGVWAGQLGDGRAISLGELVGEGGRRWELQLKGAGPTPYSRGSDGRAVLRSSLREFLCSEAMHHLGIPTTRALALVATGESVVRDMFYDGRPQAEPGAVVCRVAPSFIRFGSFELPASRGDLKLLEALLEFTVRRDFPAIAAAHQDSGERRAAWFREVCARTAEMVAHWMRVGFVHGVMNTDNMSILGQTIDYGPYGWIDAYDPDWTPNTTDRERRRYRFGQQPQVAFWNLGRLAAAVAPLFASQLPLQEGLQHFVDVFEQADRRHTAGKLGLLECGDADLQRMEALRGLLQEGEVDMTLFFRDLAALDPEQPSLAVVEHAFYGAAGRRRVEAALSDWLQGQAARLREEARPPAERVAAMNASNPRFVLRNYLAQQAIDRVEQGDEGAIGELAEVMRRPYFEQSGREAFAARRPEWARDRAGCSMLSCSS